MTDEQVGPPDSGKTLYLGVAFGSIGRDGIAGPSPNAFAEPFERLLPARPQGRLTHSQPRRGILPSPLGNGRQLRNQGPIILTKLAQTLAKGLYLFQTQQRLARFFKC